MARNCRRGKSCQWPLCHDRGAGDGDLGFRLAPLAARPRPAHRLAHHRRHVRWRRRRLEFRQEAWTRAVTGSQRVRR